jgi:hypothetical protein
MRCRNPAPAQSRPVLTYRRDHQDRCRDQDHNARSDSETRQCHVDEVDVNHLVRLLQSNVYVVYILMMPYEVNDVNIRKALYLRLLSLSASWSA